MFIKIFVSFRKAGTPLNVLKTVQYENLQKINKYNKIIKLTSSLCCSAIVALRFASSLSNCHAAQAALAWFMRSSHVASCWRLDVNSSLNLCTCDYTLINDYSSAQFEFQVWTRVQDFKKFRKHFNDFIKIPKHFTNIFKFSIDSGSLVIKQFLKFPGFSQQHFFLPTDLKITSMAPLIYQWLFKFY